MKKYLYAIVTLLLVVVAVLLAIHIYQLIQTEGVVEYGPEEIEIEEEIKPERFELVKIKVTLFFQRSDSTLLGPEEQEIFMTTSLIDRAKQVVIKLIQGPKGELLPLFPKEALLRGLFLSHDGIAYVDLSRDITKLLKDGSHEEVLAIYSIVNSLAFNFPEVKRVQILVEGTERETFGAHVSLQRAMKPNYDLIDKSPPGDSNPNAEETGEQ
jgi:hypothetical protein